MCRRKKRRHWQIARLITVFVNHSSIYMQELGEAIIFTPQKFSKNDETNFVGRYSAFTGLCCIGARRGERHELEKNVSCFR